MTPPKLKFNDIVVVIKPGFFKGARGQIIDCRTDYNSDLNEYFIAQIGKWFTTTELKKEAKRVKR